MNNPGQLIGAIAPRERLQAPRTNWSVNAQPQSDVVNDDSNNGVHENGFEANGDGLSHFASRCQPWTRRTLSQNGYGGLIGIFGLEDPIWAGSVEGRWS